MAKRANGEGTLRKRKDGRWEARYKLPNGSTKYVYGKTQKECKAKLDEVENRIKDGEFADVNSVETINIDNIEVSQEQVEDMTIEDKVKNGLPMTLNEFFKYWAKIKSMSVKPQTLDVYIYCYNANVKNILGETYINLIKETDIYNMIDILIKQGKKDKLINESVNLIFRVLDYAYKINIIKERVNKVDKIKTLRKNSECLGYEVAPHRELTDFEIKEFFDFLALKRKTQLYLICNILLNTGMRAGEVCALRRCDISDDFSYLTVNGTITNKKTYSTSKNKHSVRNIPIKKDLSQKLKEYISLTNKSGEDYVFVTKANKPYGIINLDRAIRTVVRKINKTKGVYVQPFTSHCFRHTFCSRGVRMGMPIKELQSITGHATATMLLDRYSHADESKKEKIIESISFNI